MNPWKKRSKGSSIKYNYYLRLQPIAYYVGIASAVLW